MGDDQRGQVKTVDLLWLRGAGETCWDCQHSIGGPAGLMCQLRDGPAIGRCVWWAYEPGTDRGMA
jgi:hypothetical protein